MNLTRIYDAVLTLAYPQICVICGRSVERRRFGVACETCWKGTRIFTDEERICFSRESAFTAAWAVGSYEGALRESLLLLKRQPYLPRHLESLLMAVGRWEPICGITRVIPVPLHPKRLKTRG